jgi:hypothetical protein
MVDISFDSRNNIIDTLNESRQSFERRSRTNVNIDIENFEISVGNEAWSFNSQTLVLYRGEHFSISQIRPIDSVTLVGSGDTVWLVQLDAAHGFLQINNADVIANGSMMVGNSLFFVLDDISTDIELPEGMHRVMVEGDNIETFIENITITQGQTTRLNLGDIQLRAALLQINVTPADAQVFVNGELHENNSVPAQVEFGEVFIRVEREGFHPQEQQLQIEVPVSSMTFELIEIVIEQVMIIYTQPTNARIYINNVFAGPSPHTQYVAPGTYSVVARLEGHRDSTITVTVTGYETTDIMRHLMLMPGTSDPWENMPPPDTQPLPTPTHNPFPTLAPPTPTPSNPFMTPFPTLPPDNTAPPPGGNDDPFFEIIPSDNEQWWLNPPSW